MARIIEYQTPDGVIAIEVEDDTEAGGKFVPAARGGEVVLQASEGFDAALGRVKAAANAFARTLGEIDLKPDSASVELALKFTGAAGVVFAKAGAEAQIKLTLSWKPGGGGKP